MDNEKTEKKKFAAYLNESALDLVNGLYKQDNCSSRSEYIEKAILFYSGYIANNKNENYLPNIVVSTLKSIVADSDNRQSKLLFKIAVELCMMMNVLATTQNITEHQLETLRGICVNEVKRLNGIISFDTAVEWQS